MSTIRPISGGIARGSTRPAAVPVPGAQGAARARAGAYSVATRTLQVSGSSTTSASGSHSA